MSTLLRRFMDLNAFQELGFTLNEAKIYLQIVEQGHGKPYLLASRFRLPRSTVYSALESLEKKLLIHSSKLKSATVYYPNRLEMLRELFADEEMKLQHKKSLSAEITRELRSILKLKNFSGPKIEFYQGQSEVEKFLFNNLLIWKESILATELSTWGYQDHSFVELFKRWIKECWKVIHVEAGIPGRILSNSSDVERMLKGKVPKREVRVLTANMSFESSFWVMGEFVILIMTRKNPVYAVQIHDSLLAKNLRQVFKFMYDAAIPIDNMR